MTAVRAVEASTGGSMLPVPDKASYRNAMARLAAAVNVITSIGPGGPCGFTASAVCSVTDSPPTLLVCVNRTTQSHPVMVESRVLAVNTLAVGQDDIAGRFAGGVKEMAARFVGATWTTATTGSPLLDGALASFDCRIAHMQQVGSHDVFICDVLAVREASAAAGGLVYFDRRFIAV